MAGPQPGHHHLLLLRGPPLGRGVPRGGLRRRHDPLPGIVNRVGCGSQVSEQFKKSNSWVQIFADLGTVMKTTVFRKNHDMNYEYEL